MVIKLVRYRVLFAVSAIVAGVLFLSSCSNTSSSKEPTKTSQALALAYAGCVVGEMDDTKDYSLANLWVFREDSILGGLEDYLSSQGVTWTTKFQKGVTQDIQYWNYAVQAFSTAATLDPHWSVLNTLLNSAIESKKKDWIKTHDVLKSELADSGQYSQITGICKAVSVEVFSQAKSAKVSPQSWVKSIASQYLP